MPAATEGMITDCRPSLRCSRTTAERDKAAIGTCSSNGRFGVRQAAAVASISNSNPGMARRVTPNSVMGGAT